MDNTNLSVSRFNLKAIVFNGNSKKEGSKDLILSNIGNYIYKMWRLKK